MSLAYILYPLHFSRLPLIQKKTKNPSSNLGLFCFTSCRPRLSFSYKQRVIYSCSSESCPTTPFGARELYYCWPYLQHCYIACFLQSATLCCDDEFQQINYFSYDIKVNVKWCRYRHGVAQRVGRGIALLFHYRGTGREWVVSSTPRPHFTPGNDPVLILQEAGWAPGPVWTGGKSRAHRDSIPDRPACSQSLYRLSYPAHLCMK